MLTQTLSTLGHLGNSCYEARSQILGGPTSPYGPAVVLTVGGLRATSSQVSWGGVSGMRGGWWIRDPCRVVQSLVALLRLPFPSQRPSGAATVAELPLVWGWWPTCQDVLNVGGFGRHRSKRRG